MSCTVVSHVGLISGTWDGFTAIISLVLSLFWDVRVYDVCQHSWFYDLGFIVGAAIGISFGFISPQIFVIGLIILFAVKIVVVLVPLLMWVAVIGFGVAIAIHVNNTYLRNGKFKTMFRRA
jgi:hypothetical protein